MYVEALAALITALGGFELIKWAVNRYAFRKQEAVKSNAAAGNSMVELEKNIRDMYEDTISEQRKEYTARIEELRQTNKELNEYNLELIKSGSKKDEIIDDKTIKIRELQEFRVKDAATIGELQKQLLHYKSWFCRRELGNGRDDCRRRLPAQNPPLKYTPLEQERHDTSKDTD